MSDKKQFRSVDYIDARILEIALRAYVFNATTIGHEDQKFMADHLGSISTLWSRASTLRIALYQPETIATS